MFSKFKQLYSKYTDGKIGIEEFRELRSSMEKVSDDYLWGAMLENAVDFNVSAMPNEMKNAVKNRLHRSVMRMRFITYSRYAAAAVVAVMLVTAAVFLGIDMQPIPSQEFTVSIPAGSQTNVTLPDKTAVQLNSESELAFEWDTEGERIVRLNGEAYFNVAKDKEHTFRVLVSDIEVEVHGTSFNVNAYDDDNITVSLVSGKVSLVGNGLKGNVYTMQPGEKAVYNRTDGVITISRSDSNVEIGWTRGRLTFKSKKLSEVFAMIERRYGVAIDIQCELPVDDTISGTFSNEDISYVLSSLSEMYKFQYEIKNKHITIY